MRPRRTPPPRLEVHIEHLVIEGLDVPGRQRDDLEAGLSAELRDVLTRRLSAAAVDARPAHVDELRLAVDRLPTRDGEATGRRLGQVLAAGIGPRVTPPTKEAHP
ncbi:hypothetical protein [Segeticoccus rhizosphaerae]|jgi:hypothetical protein|uniref:hypothetical protein n=1 Tax=Segeticoccus rhizosphaerae TaxID=1104777 RepID=UPI0010C08AB5|nr:MULTISPECIES: hypothetical protein [Intrasporangiaceae]